MSNNVKQLLSLMLVVCPDDALFRFIHQYFGSGTRPLQNRNKFISLLLCQPFNLRYIAKLIFMVINTCVFLTQLSSLYLFVYVCAVHFVSFVLNICMRNPLRFSLLEVDANANYF